MPNIKPNSILQLEKLMRTSGASIGTLASEIQNKEEIIDPNIVKVQVDKYIEDNAKQAGPDKLKETYCRHKLNESTGTIIIAGNNRIK